MQLIEQPTTSAVDQLRALRRDMHSDPEVGLNLPRTQARVLAALEGLDLEIRTGTTATSITAVLRGRGDSSGRSVPSVLLRGDMDALPISEASGVDYASKNGAMHACGHDLHTAGLVGAAQLLHASRSSLAGDVIFMFQPGEEGHDGARVMLREGVLDAAGARPVAAYGVHMAPDAPAGVFTTRPGTYMAGASELRVTVHGQGGHASRPYQTRDPIQVAASIVESLQVFVTRRFNVFDPVIVTVGEFHGGTAVNVVPDSADFSASIRCFSESALGQLQDELPVLINGIAEANGLTVTVRLDTTLPPTVNDREQAGLWASVARDSFGPSRFEELTNPKTGSEDFSYVLQEVPGAFGHLGAGPSSVDPSRWAPLHSSRAVFDDTFLGDHALFLARVAQRRLQLEQSGAQLEEASMR